MLTDDQLQQLKQLLIRQQEGLRNMLEHREDTSKPVNLDQQMVGRVSRIDAIQQQQMASANKKQAEIESRQIIKALMSLENGDYGYCESCDNDIPYERLMAKPTSITCISCQSKKEASH